jgi:hypothetical protein
MLIKVHGVTCLNTLVVIDTVTTALSLSKEHGAILTPWSRILPEKLAGPLLVKKFSAFYGTRRFITAF